MIADLLGNIVLACIGFGVFLLGVCVITICKRGWKIRR